MFQAAFSTSKLRLVLPEHNTNLTMEVQGRTWTCLVFLPFQFVLPFVCVPSDSISKKVCLGRVGLLCS